jgi:3-deoxy-7-phosphoheptulonate synthase/chorismate mutase
MSLESALIREHVSRVHSHDPKDGKPIRIMGPCALQSQEQIDAIMEILKGNIDYLRVCGDKPRTFPTDPKTGKLLFKGIGEEAAKVIYQQLLQQHPEIKLAAEVMNGKQLKELEGLLSIAWIGARTIERDTCAGIGEAAAQQEDPQLQIMIKNNQAADLHQWRGRIENLLLGMQAMGEACAVPIMLCLRGFYPSPEMQQQWRNEPNLKLIPELKKAFPNVAVIVDPSHMVTSACSTAENVYTLVEEGMQLGADGYMIEVTHPKHPSLTDPGVPVEEIVLKLDQGGYV